MKWCTFTSLRDKVCTVKTGSVQALPGALACLRIYFDV